MNTQFKRCFVFIVLSFFCFEMMASAEEDALTTKNSFAPSKIAGVQIPEHGIYVFKGKEYYKYKMNGSTMELLKNYPRKFPGGWQNLPAYFHSAIDAAFYYPPTKKTYFFKGDQYIRLTGIKVDKGYPKKISAENTDFKLSSKEIGEGIDAAVWMSSGGRYPKGGNIIFIKKGKFYVFYDFGGKFIQGTSGNVNNLWGQLPQGFHVATQAMLKFDNRGTYLFNGGRYLFAPGTETSTSAVDAERPFWVVNKSKLRWGVPKNIKELKIGINDPIPVKPLTKIAAGASVTIPDQGTYVFFGKKYYKYKFDVTGKEAPELLSDYPKQLPGGWQNMPDYFHTGIDAAFYYPPTKKTYMFKGGQYIRLSGFKVEAGYPKKLPGGFKGLPKIFQRDIDAAIAVTSPKGKARVVLIKNEDFVIFENWQKIHSGKLKDFWKGLPSGFNQEIQAIAQGGFWGNYLFAGEKVLFAPGNVTQKNPFLSINKGNAEFLPPKNVSAWKLPVHNTSPLTIASLCPEGNFCPELFQLLFDVRIRSYVPPRFTHFGSDGKKFNPEVENMESFHQYKTLTKVGCRYSINKVRRAIRDDMDFFEQFADLFNQTTSQWQGIYDGAKSLAANVAAKGVCGIVDPTPTCEKNVSSVVEVGINVGLAALGMPPEIPNLEQLREHGIEYLATQGAAYAVGGADQLVSEALSPAIRAAAYEASYQLAKDEFSRQLDKTIPPGKYDAEDPATWGKLIPMYAPHNAHLYLEVKVKNRNAYELILGEDFSSFPHLQLKDSRTVFRSLPSIPFPEFIPNEGIIIPIELRPAEHIILPSTGKYHIDNESAAGIPGEKISHRYLQEKFTIYDLLTQQKNFTGKYSNIYQYGYSDWDMFYKAYRSQQDTETTFELSGNFSFKDRTDHHPRFKTLEKRNIAVVDVWDSKTGVGVLKETSSKNTQWENKKFVLKNYYGRQDPICACDKMRSDPCNPLMGNTIWASWW